MSYVKWKLFEVFKQGDIHDEKYAFKRIFCLLWESEMEGDKYGCRDNNSDQLGEYFNILNNRQFGLRLYCLLLRCIFLIPLLVTFV